jgi:hypothetical protein
MFVCPARSITIAMFSHDSSSCKLGSVQKIVSFCYWLAEFSKYLCFCAAACACVCLDEETWCCHLRTLVQRVMVEGGGAGAGCREAGIGGKRPPQVPLGSALVIPASEALVSQVTSATFLASHHQYFNFSAACWNYIQPLLWCICMYAKLLIWPHSSNNSCAYGLIWCGSMLVFQHT